MMNLKDSILLFAGSIAGIIGSFMRVTHTSRSDFFLGLAAGLTLASLTSMISKKIKAKKTHV